MILMFQKNISVEAIKALKLNLYSYSHLQKHLKHRVRFMSRSHIFHLFWLLARFLYAQNNQQWQPHVIS